MERALTLGRLHQLADRLGVADRVFFSDGFVPIDDLRCAVSSADVGVVAMKRDVFRDVTLASGMFDFIAMGVPMVVSAPIRLSRRFPSCFVGFESGSPADLVQAVHRLHEDPDHRARFATRAAAAADPCRWAHRRGAT